MTDLFEKAATYGGPAIVLARDLAKAGTAVLKGADLYDHDELTPEGSFPEYGQFLEVEVDGETAYWECPGGLAEEIVEAAEEQEIEIPSCQLDVIEVAQTTDGLRFEIVLSAPESS